MSFGGKLTCKYLKNQCALRNLNEKVLWKKNKSYLASTTKLSAAFSLLSFSLVGSKTISNMFLTLVDVFDRSSSFMETALCNLRTGEKIQNQPILTLNIEMRLRSRKGVDCNEFLPDKDWLDFLIVWVHSVNLPGIFVGWVNLTQRLVSLTPPEKGFGVVGRVFKGP